MNKIKIVDNTTNQELKIPIKLSIKQLSNLDIVKQTISQQLYGCVFTRLIDVTVSEFELKDNVFETIFKYDDMFQILLTVDSKEKLEQFCKHPKYNRGHVQLYIIVLYVFYFSTIQEQLGMSYINSIMKYEMIDLKYRKMKKYLSLIDEIYDIVKELNNADNNNDFRFTVSDDSDSDSSDSSSDSDSSESVTEIANRGDLEDDMVGSDDDYIPNRTQGGAKQSGGTQVVYPSESDIEIKINRAIEEIEENPILLLCAIKKHSISAHVLLEFVKRTNIPIFVGPPKYISEYEDMLIKLSSKKNVNKEITSYYHNFVFKRDTFVDLNEIFYSIDISDKIPFIYYKDINEHQNINLYNIYDSFMKKPETLKWALQTKKARKNGIYVKYKTKSIYTDFTISVKDIQLQTESESYDDIFMCTCLEPEDVKVSKKNFLT